MYTQFGKRAVLIADDDPMIADALISLIRDRFGFEVEAVADGDSALDALGRRAFDVFITDMRMPGCHGEELVSRVHQSFPDVDVFVMTAFSSRYPYVDIIRAGASDFLSKPFHLAEMEAKLVRLLSEKTAREELARENLIIRERIAAVESGRDSTGDARYRSCFELTMTPTLLIDPDTLAIEDVNRAFCELSAAPADGLLGTPLPILIAPSSRERFIEGFDFLSKTRQGTLSDIGLSSPGGRELALDMSLTFLDVDTQRYVHIACKDVTEQRIMHDQLAEIASKDALTGLFNQRTFKTRLEGAVATARERGARVSLVSIDLDNFKQCNDTFGHPVGDDLLRAVGALIRKQIRDRDCGFRSGGDEFAILLDGADAAVAARVCERIRSAFAKSERYGTSMSFGVTDYKKGMDAAAFLRASDIALYQAKAGGKDTICVA